MNLLSVKAFYHDVKCLFGEGAITIITKNTGDEIVIKSHIQADADVIHIVNDLLINDELWQEHAFKIEAICKRLHFGANFLSTTIPLIGILLSAISGYQIFDTTNTTSLFITAVIIIITLLALTLWPKLLSSYLSKLPKNAFK